MARSSARRRSRIASRSGSARERGEIGVVERVALLGERLDAPRAELPPVLGIGRDEVALGDARAPDEVRDPRAEQRLDELRAAPVVVAVVVGVRDVGDVVHEAGDRQLGIVGMLDAQDRRALQRVREPVELRLVTYRRTRVRAAREQLGRPTAIGHRAHDPRC